MWPLVLLWGCLLLPGETGREREEWRRDVGLMPKLAERGPPEPTFHSRDPLLPDPSGFHPHRTSPQPAEGAGEGAGTCCFWNAEPDLWVPNPSWLGDWEGGFTNLTAVFLLEADKTPLCGCHGKRCKYFLNCYCTTHDNPER